MPQIKPYNLSSRVELTLWEGICLGAIGLAALLLRFVEVSQRFLHYSVLFHGPDSFYHARRVFHFIQHFPQIVHHDVALNYPQGLAIPWPPLYDALLGLLLWPMTPFYTDSFSRELILAIIPPWFGVISVVVCFYLVANLRNKPTAWLSALLLATLPAHVDGTMFANIDHHTLEPLAVMTLIYAIFLHDRLHWYWQCGLGVGLGIWLGISQVMQLYLVIYIVFLAWRSYRGKSYDWHVAGLVVSASILSIYQMHLGYPALSYKYISWLQVALLTLPWWSQRLAGVKWQQRCIGVIGFIAIAALATPSLIAASGFLGRNPVIQLISESRPIWQLAPLLWGYCGHLSLILPFWLIWRYLRQRQTFKLNPSLQFTFWLGGLLLVCATMQIRFLMGLTPLLAWGCAELMMAVQQRLPRRWAYGVIALLLYANFHPFYVGVFKDIGKSAAFFKHDLLISLEWIKSNTPDSGNIQDATQPPQYGILAPWYLGHQIVYVANRAVVANPFIFDRESPGLRDSLNAYYTWSESELFDYAQSHKLRYLWVRPLLRETALNLAVLDIPLSNYLQLNRGVYHFTTTLKQSLLYQLGFSHAKPGLATSHLRLIYESVLRENEFEKKESVHKIYEFVAGAQVHGKTKPNQLVTCKLQLITNQLRRLHLQWQTTANATGHFSFNLPYATVYESHLGVQAIGPYQITGVAGLHDFEVPIRAVEAGHRLNLN